MLYDGYMRKVWLTMMLLVFVGSIYCSLVFYEKVSLHNFHEIVDLLQENFTFPFNSGTDISNSIKGIQYNPIVNGELETDDVRIENDLGAIASTGANTVGLYNCGLFDWRKEVNLLNGKNFCEKVYTVSKELHLMMIIGYFSNEYQNWNDSVSVERAKEQFKDLVNSTKNLGNVKYYLIGNEIFEKLPDESSRIAYAKWIGEMVVWQQAIAPQIPIIYADNSQLTALPYLLQYSKSLEVYAINTYEWRSALQLTKIIDTIHSTWPDVKIYLSEFGVDSYDTKAQRNDEKAQTIRMKYLLGELRKVLQTRPDLFIGYSIFEFNDDWSKAKDPFTQNADSSHWTCRTCFDYTANEEYWGIFGKQVFTNLRGFQ
jgi:hypothetical protein